ncbi:signal peptidase I [Thalassobacillus hwangdonensis]|uniref:Signal peptidase I n=1 Tax=Thalassobacillus hwangdonensis TaxID=546108 RepID=A0ABW3KYG0_9BACI
MSKAWLEWLKAFAIAAILAIIVRVILFAPVVVEGPSMLPSLHDGDHLIVSKLNYSIGEPDRYDVVVFHATQRKDYIKRVIGLPGEHVEMKDDQLIIDGEKVDEPYLDDRKAAMNENQIMTQDFTIEELPGGYKEVPEDHVLVLGDNRNNSTDSRMLGVVPVDTIVGEAIMTYWPLDRIRFTE